MEPDDDASALPLDSSTLADRVRAIAEEVAESRGAFIVAAEVKGRTGQHIVEVFADTDAGIGIDELAKLSREIGFALDELMPGKYLLNVSSPGATKPLVLPRQFPRHVGRRVRLDVRQSLPEGAAAGTRPATLRIEGTLDAVTGGTLTVTPDGPGAGQAAGKGAGTTGEPITVAFDDLVEGRVLLPW